jgi:hypothetical protein
MPVINTLLRTTDKPILEQILWLIGNITGENEGFRDQIL